MKGKVCIVTGGANGIGRCIVETFAFKGASVYFIDKDKRAGEELLGKLAETEGQHLFIHGDLAKENDIKNFVKTISENTKSIDILINNACFSAGGIENGCTYEAFNEVLHVGVTAPFMLTQLLRSSFKEGASIVNIASTRAFQSQANTESYSAAKGGIIALTHALAISLAGRVRVNAISPGWIDTESTEYVPSEEDIKQHPSARIGRPSDIARAILFLIDPANDFINGENIVIDGGMSKQMIYHGDAGWNFRG